MRLRRLGRIVLVIVVSLTLCYILFIFNLPQLLWLSQRLGVNPDWEAIFDYIENDLRGMPLADVHALLQELDSDVGIQELDSTRSGCDEIEYVQISFGLHYSSYLMCYRDKILSSVQLGS